MILEKAKIYTLENARNNVNLQQPTTSLGNHIECKRAIKTAKETR